MAIRLLAYVSLPPRGSTAWASLDMSRHAISGWAVSIVAVAGAGLATPAAALICPDPPPAVRDLDIPRFYADPAGSKIEYITLTTGCPEGWLIKGGVNPDKSFMCAPIPDASAPTNLIHCIDGMKYFARDGLVGCRHPQAAASEPVVQVKVAKGRGKKAAKAAVVPSSQAGGSPAAQARPHAKKTSP